MVYLDTKSMTSGLNEINFISLTRREEEAFQARGIFLPNLNERTLSTDHLCGTQDVKTFHTSRFNMRLGLELKGMLFANISL